MTTLLARNFTLEDTAGVVRAAVGFAAALFSPGYLVGAATNLFNFRQRSLPERVAWAIALSYCTGTIFTILAGRLFSLNAVAVSVTVAAVATFMLLAVDRQRNHIPVNKHTVLLALFLLLAATVVVAELIDIQRGNRLHLSVTILDQSYRVVFTEALARGGIPPTNPLYHPGATAPLRYYYFWYALCAVCMKLAHVSARQALVASSIWSGLGLVAAIALFGRCFLGIGQGIYRFILTAVLLLLVTGADLLPTLYSVFVDHTFNGDLEWWSTDQITSWFDSVLWVPNHVAAMICCATAFLLLWRTQEKVSQGMTRREWVVVILVASAGVASAFGLSVYVAAGFAVLMVCWAARLLLRERNFQLAGSCLLAAATGVVLDFPYLRELLTGRSGTDLGTSTGPAHLLQLSVRKMIDPSLITGLPLLAPVKRADPRLLEQSARLLLLLPGYALELGFSGAVLVLVARDRRRLDEPRRTALFLIVCGLTIVSFVRSAVIGNNDFGYRAALLPCFFLLLLAAEKMLARRDSRPGPSRHQPVPAQVETLVLTSLLLLGVAGTIFQAGALRLYVPLRSRAGTPGFDRLPEAAFAARTVYAAAGLPPNAIVQSNPITSFEYGYLARMLYAGHGSATNYAEDCGAVFGGDPGPCPRTRAAMASLFVSPAPDSERAVDVCREFGVNFLAAVEADPAWRDRRGWVWTLPLTASSQGFRIMNCGGAGGEGPASGTGFAEGTPPPP